MFFKSSYLGIDLGMESIKVAHLAKKGNKKIITSLCEMKNPIGKTVFSNPEEQDAMRQCFIKINETFPSNGVVIGISSKYAMFRYVQFPLLNKKELREAIFWEMQEFSTIFNGEFISDYELLDKQKDIYRVLLVAVPKDIITDYIKIAGGAGFILKALDVYPLANARVLRTQRKPNVTAIIDLGSFHSEITVVGNGKIIFNRNLDFCYNNTINDEISDIILTNNNWANLVRSGFDFLPSSYQNLILEISRIFNFYSLQSKGRQIDEIILIGKGSELHHSKNVFKSYFDIEVYTGKELKYDFINNNLKIDDNHTDFLSAIGFALRS